MIPLIMKGASMLNNKQGGTEKKKINWGNVISKGAGAVQQYRAGGAAPAGLQPVTPAAKAVVARPVAKPAVKKAAAPAVKKPAPKPAVKKAAAPAPTAPKPAPIPETPYYTFLGMKLNRTAVHFSAGAALFCGAAALAYRAK